MLMIVYMMPPFFYVMDFCVSIPQLLVHIYVNKMENNQCLDDYLRSCIINMDNLLHNLSPLVMGKYFFHNIFGNIQVKVLQYNCRSIVS